MINNKLKTYKIMIDESLAYIEAFRSFLLNSHLTINILKKKSEFDEFYLKNDDFTFYYLKISAIGVLILFDKDITFDDINNVKVTLRTYIDQFENKDNYIES